jgi:release factor glutamine methyltransferase
MKLQPYFKHFISGLAGIYAEREAVTIAELVFEQVTGKSRLQRIVDSRMDLDPITVSRLETMLRELTVHRPVQYVLGTTEFLGISLRVNEAVLIPRPETAELAAWIIAYVHSGSSGPQTIADLGTGSGCLAIALKKNFPADRIIATDIHPGALQVAAENARLTGHAIEFLDADMLDRDQDLRLPALDLIVSNPPYITLPEKSEMARNVLDFEPQEALFVQGGDALLFYRAILRISLSRLRQGGTVFMECHEGRGREVLNLFEEKGFRTEIKKDFQGKERMIRAWLENMN